MTAITSPDDLQEQLADSARCATVDCFKMGNYSRIPNRFLMVKKISQEPDSAAPASFEEAIGELEQLVAQMEAGALPLEASVAAYRRGAELVRFCNAQLERVDQQVKMLEGDVLKPLSPVMAAGEGSE